jgi:hypothetical protein
MVERDVVLRQQVGDQLCGTEVLGGVVPLVTSGVNAYVLDSDGPLVIPEVAVAAAAVAFKGGGSI